MGYMLSFATENTVLALVTAAVLMTSLLSVLIWCAFSMDSRMRSSLGHLSTQAIEVEREISGRSIPKAKVAVEDNVTKYKKHLLQSSFQLQSRLYAQVTKNFMHNFMNERKGQRDENYALYSTAFMFAEFFAWMEIIRREVVFVTGFENAEALNPLLDAIRFQFSGETSVQGVGGEDGDKHHGIMQLFIIDIYSMGNVMINDNDEAPRPIAVHEFLERMTSTNPKFQSFKDIMDPMVASLRKLGKELHPEEAPIRRFVILQVLLCRLIAILDPTASTRDPDKADREPQYIPRDIRLIPCMHLLSKDQREYLRQQIFFSSNPVEMPCDQPTFYSNFEGFKQG